VDETKVRELVRSWYGSRWFAPNALKRSCADGYGSWGVYSGLDFLMRRSVRGWHAIVGVRLPRNRGLYNGIQREGVQQTRQVRHTRWEPIEEAEELGASAADMTNWLSASTGVDLELLAKVEAILPTTYAITEALGMSRALWQAGWSNDIRRIWEAAARGRTGADGWSNVHPRSLPAGRCRER